HRDNSVIASGTEARVIPAIKNTLVRLENNLPDDLMANLLLILTKCNKETVTDMSATSTQAFETMRQYRNKIKSEIAKMTQDIVNIEAAQYEKFKVDDNLDETDFIWT
ncbi:4896_t:CDS:2, partial [Gigaspora rosea]